MKQCLYPLSPFEGLSFSVFELESCFVAKKDLKLVISCFCPYSAGTLGVHHQSGAETQVLIKPCTICLWAIALVSWSPTAGLFAGLSLLSCEFFVLTVFSGKDAFHQSYLMAHSLPFPMTQNRLLSFLLPSLALFPEIPGI